MPRLIQPERGLLLVSAAVLVLAFLPTRWLAGWTADVGAIVALPLTPLRHAASGAVTWVRPEKFIQDYDPGTLDRLEVERDTYRGRWHASRLKVEELERQLQQLQQARSVGGESKWTPRTAQVVRHNPAGVGGVLSLNIGSRHGVSAGTVAVVDGDRLVGRVADGPAVLTSLLIPLGAAGDLASEDLHARILPADDAGLSPDLQSIGQPIRLQAVPGSDDFEGLVERRVDVAVGDPVRLGMDQAWHQTAWGMLIGTVSRIEMVPTQPLRKRVVVRRATSPQRLAAVTLKIEGASDGARVSVPDLEQGR
jgi:hypothetical protein